MIFDGPETQRGELFPTVGHLFCQKKNPNSQKEISVVNSDFPPAKQKMSCGGGEVRHVGFQIHQKSSKSARIGIGSGKKMLKFGTPIEIST